MDENNYLKNNKDKTFNEQYLKRKKNYKKKNIMRVRTGNHKIDLYFIDAENKNLGNKNDIKESSFEDEYESNVNLIDFEDNPFPKHVRKFSILSEFSLGI